MMEQLARAKERLISLVGFESNRELGTGASDMSQLTLDSLGNPGDWSKWFCYRSFDPVSGIFQNKDDGIGFVLEALPLVGIDDKVIMNLQHFFDKEMPDKSFLQFTLIASHKVGHILNLWQKMRVVDDPFLNNITQKRLKYMTSLAEDYGNSGLKTARNYRIIISFNSLSLSALQVINFKRQLCKKLDLLSLEPLTMSAQGLIDLTGEMMAQEADINQKGNILNPLMPLSEQVFKSGSSLEIKEQEIKSAHGITRTYGVVEYPEYWSLVDMIQLLGDTGNKGSPSTIPARFIINFTVASDMPKGSSERLIARGEQVRKTSEQFLARFDGNLKREAAEWAEVIDDLKEGRRVLSFNFTISITAPYTVIEDAETALISLYNMKGWELMRMDKFHLPLQLAMMPMQASYYWQALRFVKQRMISLSKKLVAKLPLHAEWQGNPVSGVLFQAPRGQLFNWNPFYKIAGGNYNIQVYGPSGVGKSVLIQEVATTMLSHNVKVFILDIGKSYQNICDRFDGEFIQFGSSSEISLNPLSGLVDESGKLNRAVLEDGNPIPIKTIKAGGKEYYVSLDGVMYAKNIITGMCGTGNNQHKEALIEDAIYHAIEKYGADLSISKIANVLKNGSKIERELGETLLPFTDRGMHGKYFENAANITFKKRITVFELEEVAKDETLLSVLMQVVAIQIFMQVLCGDRSQKFMLIVDEAWRALDHSEKFLAEMSRTIRKYGGSLVTCVQNVSDLSTSDHRRTIAQNSEWTIMLEQNSKGLKALEGSAYESLIPLIETIRFVKGSHSEMMLYSSRVTVIGKLLLDPYAQGLYSTDDTDFKYLKALAARGVGLNEALEELIKHKGQS
jgi:conjugal transfer ATP-binding protein TraC